MTAFLRSLPPMLKTNFFACAAAALLLCGALALPSAARAADPTIVVGTAGKETDAEVYYAQDMGFFKKAGLNVEIQTLPNGAAVASAVASGALQIGDSNTLSLATARQKGLPFAIFAPGAVYQSTTPTTSVGVAPNGPIKTAKDLTGKVLAGVSLGGLDQLSLMVWLDKNGGDSAAVKFVELPPSQMVAALERGTVSAVSLPDPQLDAALADGAARVIGNNYEAIAKTFMITGWFAMTDYIAKNPDVIKKFADAMAETAAWANANHERAAEILLKYTKIDAKKSHVRFAARLSPGIVQPVLDAGAQYKMLDKSVTVSDLLSLK
jgi:ABC-type nitrate/sulfonate/bicarbonate transport system substrate-binding protein